MFLERMGRYIQITGKLICWKASRLEHNQRDHYAMGNPERGRPRLGRPPAPKEEVRSNRIVTFLTDQQLAKLRELAERDRTSLSRACYRVLRRHLD